MNLSKAVILLLIITGVSCNSTLETDKVVTISTRLGDIKLVLFDDTPHHKNSFLELAEAGAYDSTTFHRVMENFMIQGGEISEDSEFERESRRLIPAEILPKYIHTRGMVGAARQPVNQNPERKSSTQFYIVQGTTFSQLELTTDIEQLNTALPKYLYNNDHDDLIQELKALQDSGRFDDLQDRILDLREDIEEELGMSFENTEITQAQIEAYTKIGGAPHLDGGYTVFGQVVEGMNTVDKIARLQVDSVYNPLEKVYLVFKVEEFPKDSITTWYGIEYPAQENEK